MPDNQEVQAQLNELLIGNAPPPGTQQDKDPAAVVGECVDVLRLWIKYLVFDLEATRRENRALRNMLDQRREEG